MNSIELVRHIMLTKGVSQQRLAEALGSKYSSRVSSLLHGDLKAQMLARICELLGYEIIIREKTTGETINLTYDPDFLSEWQKRSKK